MGLLKHRHRKRIKSRPFPAAWLEILEKNVGYYGLLPPDDQAELRGHIAVFLDEKRFEGCGGLEMTDEIRVTIAAEACVLLLHRDTNYYPTLRTVLVYPHSFVSVRRKRLGPGAVVEGEEARRGESWRRGPVVLSWDDVRRTSGDIHDGRNVVFHEFAHQLDGESGSNEGAPNLPRRSMYVAWARVLGEEYAQLLDDVGHHRPTDIDAYGGTSPAEFFAVVTEEFFERPLVLREKHPALYQQLATFYRQDPAELRKED